MKREDIYYQVEISCEKEELLRFGKNSSVSRAKVYPTVETINGEFILQMPDNFYEVIDYYRGMFNSDCKKAQKSEIGIHDFEGVFNVVVYAYSRNSSEGGLLIYRNALYFRHGQLDTQYIKETHTASQQVLDVESDSTKPALYTAAHIHRDVRVAIVHCDKEIVAE